MGQRPTGSERKTQVMTEVAAFSKQIRIGLFVTCLVDLFRPAVGFATIKTLEDQGCKLHVPVAQTCCGQTAWNCNDKTDTREIAEEVIQNFEHLDYVIVPSKPCAQMMKKNYALLFAEDPKWCDRAVTFSNKIYELTLFLEEVLGVDDIKNKLARRADILVGDDLGELLEIASNLKRQGINKEIRHVAEVLAGMTDSPSIGGL